jgi:hypothetical protein
MSKNDAKCWRCPDSAGRFVRDTEQGKRAVARPVEHEELELTREELVAEAEALAREVLDVSAAEAWERVRAGAHEGTYFAARLAQIFFLLGDNKPESGERLSRPPESHPHHAAAE